MDADDLQERLAAIAPTLASPVTLEQMAELELADAASWEAVCALPPELPRGAREMPLGHFIARTLMLAELSEQTVPGLRDAVRRKREYGAD